MSRRPKPYLHRGWYVTNVGGHRHKLCTEEAGREAAENALLDLLQQRRRPGGRNNPRLTVAEMVALFLDSVQVERSPGTYDNYRRWLEEFCKFHGSRRVKDITPLDAQNFKNDIARRIHTKFAVERPYKPATINHATTALKACWNWA